MSVRAHCAVGELALAAIGVIFRMTMFVELTLTLRDYAGGIRASLLPSG